MWIIAVAVAALVLNEVLYDPAGPDAGREFVELINPDSLPIPLAGLELEAGDGARPGTWRRAWRGSVGEIPAGGLFVIGGDSVAAAGARLEIDLQNGPDALRLRRDTQILDRLGYGTLLAPELFEGRPAIDAASRSLARWPDGRDTDDNAADFIAAAPSPGRRNRPRRNLALALEPPDPVLAWPGRALHAAATVRNVGFDSAAAGTWSLAARLASVGGDSLARGPVEWPLLVRGAAATLAPGDTTRFEIEWIGDAGLFRLDVATIPADDDTTDDRATSPLRVGAGPVVVNEILFAPLADAPEWIELWNRDSVEHDLAGWTLADASGRRGRLVGNLRLSAGGFAVLAADTTSTIAGLAAPMRRLAVAPWNPLNNADGDDGFADRVLLRDASGVVVDALRYTAAASPERGRSLERLVADPDIRGLLWAPSKDPGGATPGRENSAIAPPARGARLEIAPNPFTPDGDGRDDQLAATLDVPEGCSGYRARLFDLEGRCRAELGADRLGPGPRHLVWDGRDRNGSALPSGFYILAFECDAKVGPPIRQRRIVGIGRR